MSSSVQPPNRAAEMGKIARIDAMEDEEDAQFSGDESLSDDSDVDADESMDTSAVAGKEGVLASHLAFLAGAIEAYPVSGATTAVDGDADEDDEYKPGLTSTEEDAKFGSGVATEQVVVDLHQLHEGLSAAATNAAMKQAEVKAHVVAVDDNEAEFSDSEAEDSDEDEDMEEDEPSEDPLQYLQATADMSIEDDDDDEYIP